MVDRTSTFRVARLSLFPPTLDGGNARYALLAHTVQRGIPRGHILLDGVVRAAPAHPATEELLALFDSALAQHRLY